MTKNEALKAVIDGERVRHESWTDGAYLYYAEFGFVLKPDYKSEITFYDAAHEAGWRIVPKTVDFATAWKAYEEGKTIQDDEGFTYNEDDDPEFTSAAIRGPWLIL